MAKTFKITKKTWKNILAIVLSCVLAIGSIVGITALFEKIDENTTKTITPTYKVGGINTKTGKGDSSITSSIYTKDAFECQGLKITPDFDSAVSYEVFFYDNNEEFLSSSGSKTDFYESDNIFAKYARIVITPLEDDKVSWFETSKYSSQLKVEVNKDQNYQFVGYSKIDYTLYAQDKAFTYAEENNLGDVFSEPRDYTGYDVISFDCGEISSLIISTSFVHEPLRILIVDSSNLVTYTDAYSEDYVSIVDIPLNSNTVYISVKKDLNYCIYGK